MLQKIILPESVNPEYEYVVSVMNCIIMKQAGLSTLFVTLIISVSSVPGAEWFDSSKYGIFVHFLGAGPDWNAKVNGFDVELFVSQMRMIAPDYVIFTLGQNSGYYCSPNATYESYIGKGLGQRCSERDLPMELGTALGRAGIKMMLYLPLRAPQHDRLAMESLGDNGETQPAPQDFTKKWSAVIAEWGLRYGKRLTGWWFDGAYNATGWSDLSKPCSWQTLGNACRTGNRMRIIAFCSGHDRTVAFRRLSDEENFTAGEQDTFGETPVSSPAVSGMTWHILSHLGSTWAKDDGPFRSDAWMAEYIKKTNSLGGVVTMDVHVEGNGRVYEPHLKQLLSIVRAIKPSVHQ